MSCSHARQTRTSRLNGELTIYTAAETRDRLFTHLGDGNAVMMLDLEGVTEIDTAGVQILMVASNTAVAAGGAFRLINLQTGVRETLGLLRLTEHFESTATHCPACLAERAKDAPA